MHVQSHAVSEQHSRVDAREISPVSDAFKRSFSQIVWRRGDRKYRRKGCFRSCG